MVQKVDDERIVYLRCERRYGEGGGTARPSGTWLGLAAGILSAIGISVKFASGFSAVAVVGMVLMMVFEVTFGIWLLFFSHADGKEGLVQ